MLLGFEMISVDVIPTHLRQCFMIRMSSIAKLSAATEVVEVCGLLRESIDSSGDKFQQVINMISSEMDDLICLSSSQHSTGDKSLDNNSFHSKQSSADLHHSPHDVKVRISRSGFFSRFSS
jgi:hypothetical protein